MTSGFLAQLFARDPRKEARFPDVPLDQALVGLEQLLKKVSELSVAPPSAPTGAALRGMPPVLLPEEAGEDDRAADVEAPSVSSAVSAPLPGGAGAPVPAAVETDEALTGALAGLATQIWRARGKVIDPETGEPRDDMRRIHRHIEGAFDVFDQMGLSMKDWTKQPYDAGLPVKVLTFQPTPGILRDTVLEVVRPTVIWKDRILQLGEVIVGIPENTDNKTQ